MCEANNHCELITSHRVHMYQVSWKSEGVVIFCVDLAWNYPTTASAKSTQYHAPMKAEDASGTVNEPALTAI